MAAGRVQSTALALICALAAMACATPPPPSAAPSRPAWVSPPFPAGARAPIRDSLTLCEDALAYNVGPVSAGGAVLSFRPWLDTPAGPLLANPTDAACLSQGYGPKPSGGRFHDGLDLAPRAGLLVYAAGGGRVIGSDWLSGYGLTLRIDHGAGVETWYAHLDPEGPRLREGAWTQAGAPVAQMGMTGNATGVHLHYEVRLDGIPLDPLGVAPRTGGW